MIIVKDKKDIKGKKMGGEEQRDWESRKRYWEKFKPKVKEEKKEEPFVKKEKFLERIFDKRIKPGEELSNRDKTRLYLREISENLLERRKKGGKKVLILWLEYSAELRKAEKL